MYFREGIASVDLTRDRTTLGRGAGNTVCLRNPVVSSSHCVLSRSTDGAVIVEDLRFAFCSRMCPLRRDVVTPVASNWLVLPAA